MGKVLAIIEAARVIAQYDEEKDGGIESYCMRNLGAYEMWMVDAAIEIVDRVEKIVKEIG